jgi:hypothetical protein
MQFEDFQSSGLSLELVFTDSVSAAAPAKPTYRKLRELVGQLKACSKCGESQDLSEYAHRHGTRAASCRACQKKNSDANYEQNKPKRVADARVRAAAQRTVLRALRDAYLNTCECENCTTPDKLRLRVRLDFAGLPAHVVIGSAMSKSRLETAIANSIVLCETCLGRENVLHPQQA